MLSPLGVQFQQEERSNREFGFLHLVSGTLSTGGITEAHLSDNSKSALFHRAFQNKQFV